MIAEEEDGSLSEVEIERNKKKVIMERRKWRDLKFMARKVFGTIHNNDGM